MSSGKKHVSCFEVIHSGHIGKGVERGKAAQVWDRCRVCKEEVFVPFDWLWATVQKCHVYAAVSGGQLCTLDHCRNNHLEINPEF